MAALGELAPARARLLRGENLPHASAGRIADLFEMVERQ
jgi:hypothetical protein